jgi:hypothetical protein
MLLVVDTMTKSRFPRTQFTDLQIVDSAGDSPYGLINALSEKPLPKAVVR